MDNTVNTSLQSSNPQNIIEISLKEKQLEDLQEKVLSDMMEGKEIEPATTSKAVHLWNAICHHSSHAQNPDLIDRAITLFTILGDTVTEESENKQIITSALAQLAHMQTIPLEESPAPMRRIIPLEIPQADPSSIDVMIKRAASTGGPLPIGEVKQLFLASKALIKKPQGQEDLVYLLSALICKLSPTEILSLLQDKEVYHLISSVLSTSFSDTYQKCMERIETEPHLFQSFSTFLFALFSSPDFAFHRDKESMVFALEAFLIQYSKLSTPETAFVTQKLFTELFIRSFRKSVGEIHTFFIAYIPFFCACRPPVDTTDVFVILHFVKIFPDLVQLHETLSHLLKTSLPSIIPFYEGASLELITPCPENPDEWGTAAAKEVHHRILGISKQIGSSDTLDLTTIHRESLTLFAQVDLLCRAGAQDAAYQLSIFVICMWKNAASFTTIPLFFDSWEKHLHLLQKRYDKLIKGEENLKGLEKMYNETQKFLQTALVHLQKRQLGLTQNNLMTKQSLHEKTLSLLEDIQSTRFDFSADPATEMIQANFSQFTIPANDISGSHRTCSETPTEKMPGRSACMMIAGCTAWMMLQDRMIHADDLHEAMLRGIFRYQSVVTAMQDSEFNLLKEYLLANNDGSTLEVRDGDLFSPAHLHALDDLIQSRTSIAALERSFQIPEVNAHRAWEEKLLWLESQKQGDESIAAVVIKGSSAFSVMIDFSGDVQITDSHTPRFEEDGAFSKRFDHIEEAAFFLSALYPYTLPESKGLAVDPQNQVEFIPVVLQKENLEGIFQPLQEQDSTYLAECLPKLYSSAHDENDLWLSETS